MDKQEKRDALACAAKLAEEKLTARVKSGRAQWPDSPFTQLTALAVYAISIVNGGDAITATPGEVLKVAQFIVTADEYTPGRHLPFTKEQMKRAFDEE